MTSVSEEIEGERTGAGERSPTSERALRPSLRTSTTFERTISIDRVTGGVWRVERFGQRTRKRDGTPRTVRGVVGFDGETGENSVRSGGREGRRSMGE